MILCFPFFFKNLDIQAKNNLKQRMNDFNEKVFYPILLLLREFLSELVTLQLKV